jgi:PAB-dependent poly(A)-specific ribonuclease subunit 3
LTPPSSNSKFGSVDGSYNDFLEQNLSRELENARLVRLLIKLGFVDSRLDPDELTLDPASQEKSFVRLFREYLFQQVDSAGEPVVDLAHVLACLNKLDVGTEEKIMLISRDERTCIIISYKEVCPVGWGGGANGS